MPSANFSLDEDSNEAEKPSKKFPIIKGRPLPKEIGERGTGKIGRPPKYPWWDMEIGDSFLVPPGEASKVSVSATNKNKLAALKGWPHLFRVRKDKEDGQYYCQRVE